MSIERIEIKLSPFAAQTRGADGIAVPLTEEGLAELSDTINAAALARVVELEEQLTELPTITEERDSLEAQVTKLTAPTSDTTADTLSQLSAAFDAYIPEEYQTKELIDAYGTVRVLIQGGKPDLAVRFLQSIDLPVALESLRPKFIEMIGS